MDNSELYYMDDIFERKPSPPWEVKVYKKPVNSKGDLEFNNCSNITKRKDKSERAYQVLDECKSLLIDRKRWPDRMNQDIDAKTWIAKWWSDLWWQCFDKVNHPYRYVWSKITRFFGLKKETTLFRNQHFMTRDPYEAFYEACIFLGKDEYIKEVSIPFYLYRGSIWKWRKELISLNKKDYVIMLIAIRANAIAMKYRKLNNE